MLVWGQNAEELDGNDAGTSGQFLFGKLGKP
jgi:hypothetical protein